MKINLEEIEKLVEAKYISKKKHPTADLYIYNYTKQTQFEKYWNEYTMMCRGLITDGEGNIVARPFSKFFNYGEYEGKLPDGKFTVEEKFDGSLGILYWVDDKPYLATRGSFISEQAIKGTEILNKMIDNWNFDKKYTYLFEIIYPENRVVVNYGAAETLVLLAIINTETGEEGDIDIATDKHPHRYLEQASNIDEASDLIKQNLNNKEGFVLKWPNGFRLKMKFDEYVRLHSLLTGLTARRIWENLRQNKSVLDSLDSVPDEFYVWVRNKVKTMKLNFQEIHNYCNKKAKEAKEHVIIEAPDFLASGVILRHLTIDKLNKILHKATDEYFNRERPELTYLCWMFYNKRDKTEIANEIWDRLYPEHELPFKQEE